MNSRLLRFRLRKLRGLGGRELAWLVGAQAALLWAALVVRLRPVGRLVSTDAQGSAPTAAQAESMAVARRLETAVERAANHGVLRPTCLVKSVALQRLLRSRGIGGSRIQIGVRLRDGSFVAHAWVEWNGEVLGDTPVHVGGFDPLCDVDLAVNR